MSHQIVLLLYGGSYGYPGEIASPYRQLIP